MALTKNAHCEQTSESLTRKLTEKENLFGRLNRELITAKSKVNELTDKVAKQKSHCEQVDAQNKTLLNTVNDLTREKELVETTLGDYDIPITIPSQ